MSKIEIGKRQRVREAGQSLIRGPEGRDKSDGATCQTELVSQKKTEEVVDTPENTNSNVAGDQDEVLVCQVKSISQYTMGFKVGGISVSAVVDTAA